MQSWYPWSRYILAHHDLVPDSIDENHCGNPIADHHQTLDSSLLDQDPSGDQSPYSNHIQAIVRDK